jgi:DNA-binding protein HU-beta
MTKSELVTNLASSSGVPKRQVEQILDAVVENVVKTVRKGDSLKIPGLGIFRLRRLRARIGRNPQTGEPLKIPARKKVGFTVAKSFKETVLGTARR